MALIDRPAGLEWLRQWRDHEVVKVVTGLSRCGKSTLLALFADELQAGGVHPTAIQRVNLGDTRFRDMLDAPEALYDHIAIHIRPGVRNYIFFDEVHLMAGFQRLIERLFWRDDLDLYVTGATAGLQPGDLATLLGGHHVSFTLLPLGFAEYVGALGDDPSGRPAQFGRFVAQGGLPYVTRLADQEAVRTYLDALVSAVLLRDVVTNAQIRDQLAFHDVVTFLADALGSLITPKQIADGLTAAGRRISSTAVEKYLKALTDAHLILPVPRWDPLGKRRLDRQEKYYLADTGLRETLLPGQSRDQVPMLENVVLLELLRRGYQVWDGNWPGHELSFVAVRNQVTNFIQVVSSLNDGRALNRSSSWIRPATGDQMGLLLTMDPRPVSVQDGILCLNLVDWLMGSADLSDMDAAPGRHRQADAASVRLADASGAYGADLAVTRAPDGLPVPLASLAEPRLAGVADRRLTHDAAGAAPTRLTWREARLASAADQGHRW
jgi:predicted AAA+ superfamily ATPase